MTNALSIIAQHYRKKKYNCLTTVYVLENYIKRGKIGDKIRGIYCLLVPFLPFLMKKILGSQGINSDMKTGINSMTKGYP